MILQADAKQLEINVAAYLSQDPILLEEIRTGFDLHSDNQQRLGLPSRLISKIFVFRLIYGGTAYAYSVDSDFAECNMSAKEWQKTIDKYYEKYKGLEKWHRKIVEEVTLNRFLKMPTGREYHYSPKTNYKGELEWPRTQILNYPVQGLGADLMSIARVGFFKKFLEHNIKGVVFNTVHDSIECDIYSSELDKTIELFYQTFKEIPGNFQKIFGVEYNLPLFCEISYGKDRKNLTEV